MYQVVHNTDLTKLEAEVNSLLASRWELAGNLVVEYQYKIEEGEQVPVYLQPMRKR